MVSTRKDNGHRVRLSNGHDRERQDRETDTSTGSWSCWLERLSRSAVAGIQVARLHLAPSGKYDLRAVSSMPSDLVFDFRTDIRDDCDHASRPRKGFDTRSDHTEERTRRCTLSIGSHQQEKRAAFCSPRKDQKARLASAGTCSFGRPRSSLRLALRRDSPDPSH